MGVVEAALFLLFAYCRPSPLSSSHAEADAKDSYESKRLLLFNDRISEESEISLELADMALVFFEGLGLLTTEYGIFDYLRGQMLLAGASTQLTLDYSSTLSSSASTSTAATDTAEGGGGAGCHPSPASSFLVEVPIDRRVAVEDVCSLETTSPSVQLSIRAVLHALAGLQSTIDARFDVLRMRLQCLYLILHSRIPQERIHYLLCKDAGLVRDLVSLSDKSSDAVAELSTPLPSSIVFLALENVLYLIDVNGFRRSDSNLLHRPTDVCEELGLSIPLYGESSSQTPPWLATLQSCCNAACSFGNGVDDEEAEGARRDLFFADTNHVRCGLRLFNISISLQDHIFPNRESSSSGDASSIGPMAALLETSIPYLARLIASAHLIRPSRREEETLLTFCRALTSLELCANFGSFRECDVLRIVGGILAVFTTLHVSSMHDVCKLFLERTLGLLMVSINCGRRNTSMPMDSGVNCLYQQYFTALASQVFSSPFPSTHMLWFSLLELICAAINAEPAFLSNFLHSDYSQVLLAAVKADRSEAVPAEEDLSLYRSANGYVAFLPLLKLMSALSITHEGIQYAMESRIATNFLSSFTNSCFLLPESQGIPFDVLRKCGKYLFQIIRELPPAKRSIYDGVRSALLYACYEALRASETTSSTSQQQQDTSYMSDRHQALQKVSYVCTLVENISTSEGRRATNDFLRDVLKEDVIDALFKAYACSLPLPCQLFAQITLMQSGSLTYLGDYATAKAITSLMRLGVTVAHQVVLQVAFRSTDKLLNTLSNQKRLLRGFVDKTGADQGEIEAALDLEGLGLRKRRGRGSSQGQQSAGNVMILGVLDCFSNVPEVFDAFKSSMDAVSLELSALTFSFLSALLELEWCSLILAQCLRASQRQIIPSPVPGYRDSIRRLFAFLRSSMLELCRVSSTTWTPKLIVDSRPQRNALDVLDLFEKRPETPTSVRRYLLRVVSPSGALIRENIDILTSRVVYLVPVGAVLTAFERRQTSDGSIRYRTALGWLSEFRRDKEKMPLVEVLNIMPCSPNEQDIPILPTKIDASGREHVIPLRQAAAHTMGRIHLALKQVAVNLGRSIVTETPTSRSSNRSYGLADGAHVITTSLSRIVKGLVTHPFESMDESSAPKSLSRLKWSLLSLVKLEQKRGPSSLQKDESSSSKASSSLSSSVRGWRRGSLRDNEEDDSLQESVSLDAASICLYLGCVMKYIVLPILDDNTNNFNVCLIERFLLDSVMESLVDAFAFVLAVLIDAVHSPGPNTSPIETLSSEGRCALGAIPFFLQFLTKILARDTLSRSPAFSLLSELKEGEFIFRLYYDLASKLMPFYESHCFAEMPEDVAGEWLNISSALLSALMAPLPTVPERNSDRAASTSLSSRLRRGGNQLSTSFTPSVGMIRSLTLMGFEERAIVEAANSLRSNNIDEVMDRITTSQPTGSGIGTSDASTLPVPSPAEGGTTERTFAELVRSWNSSALTGERTAHVEGGGQLSGADISSMSSPLQPPTYDQLAPPALPTPSGATGAEDFPDKRAHPQGSNTERMRMMAEVLQGHGLDFILCVCDSMDKVVRWSRNPIVLIAPQLVTFLSRLKGLVGLKEVIISTFISSILGRVSSSSRDACNLYTLYLLLLHVMHHPTIGADLERSYYLRIYDNVIEPLVLEAEVAEGAYHAWIEPAILILYELCKTVVPPVARSAAETEAADVMSGDSVLGIADADQAICNQENEGLTNNAVESTIESLFILHPHHLHTLLGVATGLLRRAESRDLQPGMCHAVLLLLTTLVASHSIAADFLRCGGFHIIFALPSSTAFADDSCMLTLLARRCFETPVVLRQCMLQEIRTLLRSLPNGGDKGTMVLEGFLETTKDMYTRSPGVYLEAVSLSVRMVRRGSGKVLVSLLEEEKSGTDYKLVEDEQITATLSALMSHAFKEHAAEDGFLFSAVDAVDALTDCALCLKGLSSLIARYNCTLGSRGGSFTSVPAFIISNFLIEQYELKSFVHHRIKSSFRLLCVLCSHKGHARRMVLDAILEHLRIIVSSNNDGRNELRISRLRHLGILISHILKTSRHPSRDSKNAGTTNNGSSHSVCFDIIHYLIDSELGQLLTEGAALLPLSGEKFISHSFEALIEPLETITRPLLLTHITKLRRKAHHLAQHPTEEGIISENSVIQEHADDDIRDDLFSPSHPDGALIVHNELPSEAVEVIRCCLKLLDLFLLMSQGMIAHVVNDENGELREAQDVDEGKQLNPLLYTNGLLTLY